MIYFYWENWGWKVCVFVCEGGEKRGPDKDAKFSVSLVRS